MEVIYQYDKFREKCFSFAEKFESTCFANADLVCHPTCENEIITVCSDEEAKSNGLNICRLSDMLLMSDDNENWETFNLIQARQIAEENGFVYITDLLMESSFYAEDWMINGKNDTIVVSEEYMREKGKRYAPVTPLTNKVLHFKKIMDPFFWSPAENGKLNILNSEGIKNRFDDHFNNCVDAIPSLVEDDKIEFTIFGGTVEIDSITTRALKTDVFIAQIDKVLDIFATAGDLINKIEFSKIDFIKRIAVAVLNNNGISISKDIFNSKYYEPLLNNADISSHPLYNLIVGNNNSTDIICIKIAFIEALKAEAKFDYVYPVQESSEYYKNMRKLEQTDFEGPVGESNEKYIISTILTHKPADYVIFAYIQKRFPEETENAEHIAEFWGLEPVPENELQSEIFHMYLNDNLFDESGNFISGLDQAKIIREQLIKVNEKYRFENTDSINELDEYITSADLKRRTYNGTVFDTPEDMKRAMANELELQALCVNLSALDESELLDLRKHISLVTADEATKAKYLVKVKIALNRCEESMLEQFCLNLPMLDADETIKLKSDVEKLDYAESVIRPKLADINDHLNETLKDELEKYTEALDTLSDEEIAALSSKIASDRYPRILSEYYLHRIEEFTDNKIKAKIENICNKLDTLDMEGLVDAREQLSAFPERYVTAIIAGVNARIAEYEKNEIARLFENIDFADTDEIKKIKSTINAKNYSAELLAPYAGKIEHREQEILDDELISMFSGIEEMSQEQIDELKAHIASDGSKYSTELIEKCNEKIVRRECELKNSELAELCKYIFSMEQNELDELKETLLSDKYDEELTTIYLKKVTEREDELRKIELDKLCENISEYTEEQLVQLKNDIRSNQKFVAICDSYCDKIDTCIKNIKNAEFNKLLDSVNDMDDEALEIFRKNMNKSREEIGEEFYARSVEKADARAAEIEIEKLNTIISDIDSFDIETAFAAITQIEQGPFKQENKDQYILILNEKVEQLYTDALDSMTADIENMEKEQLVAVVEKIKSYDCPAELKASYIHKTEKQIFALAEKELHELCGDINSLSAKKCSSIITKIRTLSIDNTIKNQYLDLIEAHIMVIRENEQNEYIDYLKRKIQEFNVSTVNFLVPTISNLFVQKYDDACKTYVSAGRYEFPIFMHENGSDSGFTLTTEYFYYIVKGVVDRIKIDNLISFQAKKGLMATSITVTERSGNTHEIPCAINKNFIDATVKAMTALVSYIKDKRSAEHMKELLENAVQERTQEIAVAMASKTAEITAQLSAQQPAPQTVTESPAEVNPPVTETAAEETDETKEPAKIKFCDQCGAKITNPSAKFCAECGNKLS